MPSVLALIPARGGSKSIPKKNIVPLLGKPLLAYSIEAALQSGVIDHVYVSSDDAEILSAAQQFGATPLQRTPSLALDESPTDPVIADFIAKVAAEPEDIIVLLQPTSPLRTAEHVRAAVESFQAAPAGQAVISVCNIDNKVLKAYLQQGDYLEALAGADFPYKRRQDLPALYMPNGALYIFSVRSFTQQQGIPRQQLKPYRMTVDDSADIDTLDDLRKAEQILVLRQQQHASK
jgi:CMP-N,N'-diacetyllegionaminic acid synthase